MSVTKGCAVAVLLLVVLAGLIGFAGYRAYVSVRDDTVQIQQETDVWLAAYNTQHFATCYARAHASLRQSASEADYVVTLAKLYGEHGSLTLGEQVGLYIDIRNGAATATVRRAATTQRGAVELVILLSRDATWGVTGFIIRAAAP